MSAATKFSPFYHSDWDKNRSTLFARSLLLRVSSLHTPKYCHILLFKCDEAKHLRASNSVLINISAAAGTEWRDTYVIKFTNQDSPGPDLGDPPNLQSGFTERLHLTSFKSFQKAFIKVAFDKNLANFTHLSVLVGVRTWNAKLVINILFVFHEWSAIVKSGCTGFIFFVWRGASRTLVKWRMAAGDDIWIYRLFIVGLLFPFLLNLRTCVCVCATTDVSQNAGKRLKISTSGHTDVCIFMFRCGLEPSLWVLYCTKSLVET